MTFHNELCAGMRCEAPREDEPERSEPQHPGCAGCGIALPIEVGETVTAGDPCPNCMRPIPGFLMIRTSSAQADEVDEYQGDFGEDGPHGDVAADRSDF